MFNLFSLRLNFVALDIFFLKINKAQKLKNKKMSSCVSVFKKFSSLSADLNRVSAKHDCHLIVTSEDSKESILISGHTDLLSKHSEFLRLLFQNPLRQGIPVDVDTKLPRYQVKLPGPSTLLWTFHRLINLMISFDFHHLTSESITDDLTKDQKSDFGDLDLVHLCFMLQVTDPLLGVLLRCFFDELVSPPRDLLPWRRRELVQQALEFATFSPGQVLLRDIYDLWVMSEFPEYPLDRQQQPLPLPFPDPPKFLGERTSVPILNARSWPEMPDQGRLELHLLGDCESEDIELPCSRQPSANATLRVSMKQILSMASAQYDTVSLGFVFSHDLPGRVLLDLTPSLIQIFVLGGAGQWKSQGHFLRGVVYPCLVLESWGHTCRSKQLNLDLIPTEWFPIRLRMILNWKLSVL